MSRRDDIRVFGRVKRGEIVLERDRWVDAQLGEVEGETVYLTIEPVRDRRSLRQNAYYWGVVLRTIADWNGDDPDELHEYFKSKFLKRKKFLCNKEGEILDEEEIVDSTTRLRVMAFSEYVQKIIQWAGEFLHLNIPEASFEKEQRKADR